MGEVFRAFDEKLHRQVAVKALAEHVHFGEDAKARLLREARLLSKLDHPGICRVFDLAESDGEDYLVLEYIEGKTLREAGTKVADRELLEIMADVADALTAAHREGIVHRDLKPENIMITDAGEAKILDFGIARSLEPGIVVDKGGPESVGGEEPGAADVEATGGTVGDSVSSTEVIPGGDLGNGASATLLTRGGAVMGTVQYMSPEQAVGGEITSASDMYSFGILLHELATGDSPYGDAVLPTLLLKVYRAETAPVDGLDAELARLVERLESVDPAARPTAVECRDTLRRILDRPARERRRRMRIAMVAAVVTALAVLGSVAVYNKVMAGRRASVAQRFAAEAKDMEWQLRAEFLSPPHNVRPAMDQMQDRMAALEEQIEIIGDTAVGPGHYALGRVRLSLGELESAREHLERSWQSGHQEPEVKYAQGLVLGRLYQAELKRIRNVGDQEIRKAALNRADEELKQPALRFLELGRNAPTAFPAYVEGLIALYEGRFDDALTAAVELEDRAPWFYEADILRGSIHEAMANRASLDDGDSERTIEETAIAAEFYLRAREVARSDPNTQILLCQARVTRLHQTVRTFRSREISEIFDEALIECRRAVDLDPMRGRVFAEQARIFAARGTHSSRQGGDPTGDFDKAIELTGHGLEVEPGSNWALGVRAWVFYEKGWHEVMNGIDARESFDHAIADFAELGERPDSLTTTRLNHADSYYGRAVCELVDGNDPTEFLERGIEVAEEGLRISPESSGLLGAMGNLSTILGRQQAATGGDARPAFERAIASYTTSSENSSNPENFRNLALVETDLADYLLTRGGDPRPVLSDAVEHTDRAIELNPDYGYPQLVKGMALHDMATYAALVGDDPSPYLDQAGELYETAADLIPRMAEPRLRLALVEIERANLALESNRDPMAFVRSGRAAVKAAEEIDPDSSDAIQVRGKLEIAEARWLAGGDRDAGPRFREALRLALSGSEKEPDVAVNHLEIATVHLEHSRWLLKTGKPASAELGSGLDAVDGALAINQDLAQAFLVRAELLALRFSVDGDQNDRGAAREALARAVELNPLLDLRVAEVESDLSVDWPVSRLQYSLDRPL